MWLLSGYDNRIHAYKSDERQICEEKIEEYFIEFKGTNDEVSVMFDTKSFSDYKKYLHFILNEAQEEELNSIIIFLLCFQKNIVLWHYFGIFNVRNC